MTGFETARQYPAYFFRDCDYDNEVMVRGWWQNMVGPLELNRYYIVAGAIRGQAFPDAGLILPLTGEIDHLGKLPTFNAPKSVWLVVRLEEGRGQAKLDQVDVFLNSVHGPSAAFVIRQTDKGFVTNIELISTGERTLTTMAWARVKAHHKQAYDAWVLSRGKR
jgi:hypothetical protein